MSSSALPSGTFGRGGISAFSKGPSKEIGSAAELPLPDAAAGADSSSLKEIQIINISMRYASHIVLTVRR